MPNENRKKQLPRRNRKNAGKLPSPKSKAVPIVEPEAKSTLRDFLTLRFPKQPPVATKGKRKTWDKKKRARHQRNKIAKISNSVLTASKQPQAEKTELSPLSQFPALQAPSRRKFIKMAGMTVAAAALWRQAVAAGGNQASSAGVGFGGNASFTGSFSSQTEQFGEDERSSTRSSDEAEAMPTTLKVNIFSASITRTSFTKGIDGKDILNVSASGDITPKLLAQEQAAHHVNSTFGIGAGSISFPASSVSTYPADIKVESFTVSNVSLEVSSSRIKVTGDISFKLKDMPPDSRPGVDLGGWSWDSTKPTK